MQFYGVVKLDQGWIAAESPKVDILFDKKTIFQFKVQYLDFDVHILEEDESKMMRKLSATRIFPLSWQMALALQHI